MPKERISTIGGVIAVAIWSTSIAFSRGLTESLGIFTAGACAFLLAGAIGTLWALVERASRPALDQNRRAGTPALPSALYLFVCGGMFIVYQLCFYLAVGMAHDSGEVVEVGILNYLWPVLTAVLSVPILKARASAALIPGALLAVCGTVLARTHPQTLPASISVPVLLLGLGAALSWALYSNLTRRLAAPEQLDAVPLFFLASGMLMLMLRFIFQESSHWTPAALSTLAYVALLPCLLAYTLWDRAMRRGDIVLVTVISYFTPLVSTIVTCAYLHVVPGWNVWVACGLLIAGAALSRWSLKTE
ncbi:MAG TPA: EamA family transporter [Planctomycetota bacterium]|jgi:drug/metabolite transporter (DMT)-like permease